MWRWLSSLSVLRVLSALVLLSALPLVSPLPLSPSFLPVSFVSTASAAEPPVDALNRVIEITDSGPIPSTLDITSKDLTVFLLNNTKTSLVSFEIDYGKQEIHCSNANVKNLPDGKARTIAPLSPRDFISTCFHQPGVYPIHFYGVGASKSPLTATVTLR